MRIAVFYLQMLQLIFTVYFELQNGTRTSCTIKQNVIELEKDSEIIILVQSIWLVVKSNIYQEKHALLIAFARQFLKRAFSYKVLEEKRMSSVK